MFCTTCGAEQKDGVKFCTSCGDGLNQGTTPIATQNYIMEHRDPILVFLLTFITFGIYMIVWFVKTKDQINAQGAQVPTAWIWLLPFGYAYLYLKLGEGIEMVTNQRMSAPIVFLLLFFLSALGMAIVQYQLNQLSE